MYSLPFCVVAFSLDGLKRIYTEVSKMETINFRAFVRNEWRQSRSTALKIVSLGGSVFAVMAPRSALAASADATFNNVFGAVMNIVDWVCVGVFIFAGVSWMFGHRTKALEIIIGGTAGYILARHAIDIRDFLKTL
jgi:hypothetical protein